MPAHMAPEGSEFRDSFDKKAAFTNVFICFEMVTGINRECMLHILTNMNANVEKKGLKDRRRKEYLCLLAVHGGGLL